MSRNNEYIDQPKYGQRLIPKLLDELAETTPDRVFALIPRSAQYADGLQDVTISTFARAVNRAAFWIDSNIGKGTDFETIAYIGPCQCFLFTIKSLVLTSHSGPQVLYHCNRCFETGLQGPLMLDAPRN